LSTCHDKANGDFLKLKEAQLTGGIDPSGKTTLRDDTVKEGSYEMNLNLIKRKFDIKSGNLVIFYGFRDSGGRAVISRLSIKFSGTYRLG
jgi:hypothetical protein